MSQLTLPLYVIQRAYILESARASNPRNAPLNTFDHSADATCDPRRVSELDALGVPPHAVVADAMQVRILYAMNCIQPLAANLRAVEHHVHFLGVEPRLGIHISITRNTNRIINNHQLDMTIPLLKMRIDWLNLVPACVPMIP